MQDSELTIDRALQVIMVPVTIDSDEIATAIGDAKKISHQKLKRIRFIVSLYQQYPYCIPLELHAGHFFI